MIHLITAENRHAYANALAEMHRQRHQLFNQRLGWELPHRDGQEIDDYDTQDARYLLIIDPASGEQQASLRLLPTAVPHLLSDLFADLCIGVPPAGPHVWEVSRYCTNPGLASQRAHARAFGEIICGLLEVALITDIEQLVFVTSMSLAPRLINAGWEIMPLGLPVERGGDSICAFSVAVTPQGLRQARRRFNINDVIMRYLPIRQAA